MVSDINIVNNDNITFVFSFSRGDRTNCMPASQHHNHEDRCWHTGHFLMYVRTYVPVRTYGTYSSMYVCYSLLPNKTTDGVHKRNDGQILRTQHSSAPHLVASFSHRPTGPHIGIEGHVQCMGIEYMYQAHCRHGSSQRFCCLLERVCHAPSALFVGCTDDALEINKLPDALLHVLMPRA